MPPPSGGILFCNFQAMPRRENFEICLYLLRSSVVSFRWSNNINVSRWHISSDGRVVRPAAREELCANTASFGRIIQTHTRRSLSPSKRKSLRCAARSSRTPEAIFLFLRVYRPPIRMASTAFWACRRFSVSSKISSAWRSKVSTAISSPLRAGRQCSTMQSGLARASSSSFT